MNPLFSEEAEQAVIGAILMDFKKSMPVINKLGLGRQWFLMESCATAFNCIMDLHKDDKIVDVLTVSDLMSKRGMDTIQSNQILLNAIDKTTSAAYLENYLEIVRDYYLKRQQRAVITEHNEKLDSELTNEAILASLRAGLDLIEIPQKESTAEEIKTMILESHEMAHKEGHSSIPSRFASFNRKLHGYKRGKVCLYAARPGIGKTTLALNEVEHMGSQNYRVGVASFETDVDEVYETLAGIRSGVNLFRLRDGELKLDAHERFKKALDQVLSMPIFVTDKNMDIEHLEAWVNYMCYHKNLDALIIDYVQIISDGKLAKAGMREKVSTWSSRIFEMTRKNNIATILLSQISRAGEPPSNAKPEERWKYTPRLHHLKESGKLEEDAYQAILLYNHPSETVEGATAVPFIADIAKHKRGPVGQINMVYKKFNQTFQEKYS